MRRILWIQSLPIRWSTVEWVWARLQRKMVDRRLNDARARRCLRHQTTYNHKSTTNQPQINHKSLHVHSVHVKHKNLATKVALKKRSFGLSCFYFHYVNCVYTTKLRWYSCNGYTVQCKNHFWATRYPCMTTRLWSRIMGVQKRTSASDWTIFYIPCDEICQKVQIVKLSQSVTRNWIKALVPLLYYIFTYLDVL